MHLVNMISGNIIDVLNKRIYKGTIYVEDGRISKIEEGKATSEDYILPGFVDAHVHVESSMLTPCEFARLSVPHGTVATVSDPHEIANVNGVEGVHYMIDNAAQTPFKFYFGAPSCVPATSFETAGASVSVAEVEALLQRADIKYLSEMMNFPGVLFEDPEVMAKLALAKKYDKPIDGHAPGLRGEEVKKYIQAGISTDHECFTLEEALDKLQWGMKIAIREGSAAKNYEALSSLIDSHTDLVMFCSDDKHPNNLVEGHLNEIVLRSLAKGYDLMNILQCACVNPVQHYNLDVGLLQVGDPADFIVINHPDEFKILETYIDGQLVAANGKTTLTYEAVPVINQFSTSTKTIQDFKLPAQSEKIKVIEALEGQLITNALTYPVTSDEQGFAISNPDTDVLKMAVINRYEDQPPALAFIKNFGLKRGAIASSVGHDSHNIIVVGVDDVDICNAVNLIIEQKGGLSLADGDTQEILALPLAGIMTNENGYKVAQTYTQLDRLAKSLGTNLAAPYMTLSFMALLVIPSLKLSDKGLFDGNNFQFTNLFID